MPNGYRILDRRGQARPAPAPRKSPGFGKAASWNSLFNTPRTAGVSDSYRPRGFLCEADYLEGLDWRELVDFSRQLFAQRPLIGRAITQKNTYSTGDAWKPHYKGRNQAWGQEASEWLINDWYQNCDVRGGVYDFVTNLFLSGMSWDIDGDDLMVLTEDEGAAGAFPYGGGRVGYPKIQHYIATDISSDGKREVSGGQYDGARIENGVILDKNRAAIAYKIKPSAKGKLSATAATSRSYDNEGTIIPASAGQLIYEPEFRNFCRGAPLISKAILDAFDSADIDHYLKSQVKLNASQGIKKKTVTGEPDPNTDTVVPSANTTVDDYAPSTDIKVEKINGLQICYLEAGAGEDIEEFRHSTPHANVEAFVRRLDHRCIGAVGWFHELLDPSMLRGACVRLIQDQARHSVWYRQTTQKKRAHRAVIYAVARAMATGRISPNYDGNDFMMWEFNLPAQLTVDAGYDEQADRENFKLGTSTMATLTEKKGKWWKDCRRQRLEENKDLLDRAKELIAHAAAMGEKLTFREALDLMQQFGPAQRQEISTVMDEEGGVV